MIEIASAHHWTKCCGYPAKTVPTSGNEDLGHVIYEAGQKKLEESIALVHKSND
jgi:hypothetical protein